MLLRDRCAVVSAITNGNLAIVSYLDDLADYVVRQLMPNLSLEELLDEKPPEVGFPLHEFLHLDKEFKIYSERVGLVVGDCFHVKEERLDRYTKRLIQEYGLNFTTFEALGNGCVPMNVKLAAKDLVQQSVWKNAELIKKCKESSTNEYVPSFIDFQVINYGEGQTYGRKLGGVRIPVKKGRSSQFHASITNVATEISPSEPAARNISEESQRPVYPFAAIVGQDEMKLCLLLNVIDPKIGGVMIMGDRGTGKSTTVRSLVDLLPEIKVVAGDPFNSDPEDPECMGMEVREKILKGDHFPIVTSKINMVDLPLGATEDRVCGTIDIEKALTEGVKAFEPGLLAKANRGILYVDEVNLLDDHLVDVLLDSAASGWNTVEREGISISHPARFILIGSGNPEEGELRPQLLDRFGMHAQVGTVKDAELRVKIVEERARFDSSPKEFRNSYKAEQEKLQQQISSARSNLSSVQIDHDQRVKISKVCAELNVDGLRGDIVTNRAAKALAALRGRDKVTTEDIATVIPNCLRHRLRKDPLESIDSGLLVIEKFYEVFS
ncbi:Magnesium chelatase ChlI-like, catalytic domain [Dillenia turbinata]|uniref:Mg-protoporphyrin IX chelatase n=1 Tax=Dillenia turbinata TaxID=194707 RepID=A0AAN8YYJ7_9MAGN